MVTKATTKPKKTDEKDKLKKMIKPKTVAKKVSEYAKFQSEKALKIKATKDSKEKTKTATISKKST